MAVVPPPGHEGARRATRSRPRTQWRRIILDRLTHDPEGVSRASAERLLQRIDHDRSLRSLFETLPDWQVWYDFRDLLPESGEERRTRDL